MSHDWTLVKGFGLYQERRSFSKRTIACRKAVLMALIRFRPGLVTLARDDIEAFLDARDLGPQGRYTYTSHLHAFYTWAQREGHVAVDPTVTIDRPRLPKRLPKPIPYHELAEATEFADDRMACWLRLGALAGFRVGEIAALRREDIMEGSRPPMIRVTQGKGRKDRILPLHPAIIVALVRYGLPSSGPVFTHPDGTPLRPPDVGRPIARFLRSLGIDRTAHALRHHFGSAVYASSRDLLLTGQLMGHSSVQTTMGYVALNPDTKAVGVVQGLAG